jgi:hypothetical protein
MLFLQFGLDGARGVLLMNRKALRSYALACDEDAERSGVDGLQGRGLFFLFLVTGPCWQRGNARDHES